VLWLVFNRTFIYNLYALALPNYMIYGLALPSPVVGTVMAAFALAYIAGPLVMRPLARRLGIRATLIVSVISPVVCVGLQVFVPTVSVFFWARLVDGLFLGLFWPTVQTQISCWQRGRAATDCDRYFRTYCLSWSVGCLGGELLGYLLVFGLGTDFLAIQVAWALYWVQIPIALCVEKREAPPLPEAGACDPPGPLLEMLGAGTPGGTGGGRGVAIEAGAAVLSESSLEVPRGDGPSEGRGPALTPVALAVALTLPVGLCYLGQLLYAMNKSVYNFLFPFFLYEAGQPSYFNYLLILFQEVGQIITINVMGRLKGGVRSRLFYGAFAAAILLNLAVALRPHLGVVAVALVLTGVVGGILYGYANFMMLAHAQARPGGNQAMWYEIFSGIGFGVTPLLAGIIAAGSLATSFYLSAAVLAGALGLYWYYRPRDDGKN
jgi:MFS family permease